MGRLYLTRSPAFKTISALFLLVGTAYCESDTMRLSLNVHSDKFNRRMTDLYTRGIERNESWIPCKGNESW
ncbi:protein of unknown function [Candidatus Methylomirabilis oxygeniifera]|uniref:Uncharacterized protein n=1 Tax=Methylomirabilis oxygeniifera TaxID=671143 RepID=D5MM86_METO1|nr:protein of unknown function [Candidatus Methylomirabilis oxyfera]